MSIRTENLCHVYMKGTPLEVRALEDVTVEIGDGEFVGIIGQTGSGKSTLVQHFNGLLKPTSGRVIVDGVDLSSRSIRMRDVRQKVGLVFQYPEHQLFEETVFADVAFGPRNLGLSEDEVVERVREAMEFVGLDFEGLKDRSPFDLSGGQMRRAAIAGVLAMRPSVLILDEPTAGMDPRGRDDVLGQVKRLHEKKGLTICLVSHSMEDVARLVDRIIVVHGGRVVMDGPVRGVFSRAEYLERLGLGVPQVTQMARRLADLGLPVRPDVITVEEARDALAGLLDIAPPAPGGAVVPA